MKRRIRIKRKDGIRQRYWKNYGSFTRATKTNPLNTTAYQKFGKDNIDNLQKIGEGRDRLVYALDKNKALKIAKSPAGLAQMGLESDLGSGYFDDDRLVKHYETGKDYAVMERVDRDDKLVNKFLKPFKQFTQKDFEEKTGELQDTFEEAGMSDLLNYELSIGDFKRPSSWGVRDGKPVLIDAGVLSEISLKKDAHDYDKKEWEEVNQKRRMFR